MIETFGLIVKGAFEPLFITALIGAGYLVLMTARRQRLSGGAVFILALFGFMLLWRVGMRINSTRYAAGLLIPSVVLTVLFGRVLMQLELPAVWRRRLGFAIGLGFALIAVGGLIKVMRTDDRKYQHFLALGEMLRNGVREARHPALLDTTSHGARIAWYAGWKDLPDKQLRFPKPELVETALRTLLGNSDMVVMAVDTPQKEQHFTALMASAFPDVPYRRLGTVEKLTLYLADNRRSHHFGVERLPDDPRKIVWSQDFEKTERFDNAKHPALLKLRQYGFPFAKAESFEFVKGIEIVPHGDMARYAGIDCELTLSPQPAWILEGKHSLYVRSPGYFTFLTSELDPRKPFSLEFTVRGAKSAEVRIQAYTYGDKKYFGAIELDSFYALEDGTVKQVYCQSPQFTGQLDRIILVFQLQGELSIDCLKIRQNQ